MLDKYFRTGIRSLSKQKFYTFLNISGFGLGLAMFFFICLFLYDQFSYDRWYNHKPVYRVEAGNWGILGPAYGDIIRDASPDIASTLRMNTFWGHNIVVKTSHEKSLRIPYLVMADTTVFDFFDFRFIHGSPEIALSDRNNIVLTQSQAQRLFGRDDVSGEFLRLSNDIVLRVSGVIEDVKHFHIRIDALASFMLFGDIYSPDFFLKTDEWNHLTYIKVHPGSDIQSVSKAIENRISEYIHRAFSSEFAIELNLRPVADIYFTNTVAYESMVIHGNKMSSYAFLAIAVFILFIAIINFVNLATARSGNRSREVGIRKLLGSDRRSLVFQFLTESILVTAMALVVALTLVELFSPVFSRLVGDLAINYFDLGFWGLAAIFLFGSVVIGFVSGIYPSFYLSRFQPVTILKGETTKGRGALLFRKILIVFQFTTSICLIAGTLIVYQQLHFMQTRDVGFHTREILYLPTNPKIRERWDAFRNTLLGNPLIHEVGLSNSIPGRVSWQESMVWEGESRQYTFWPMTPEYLSMLEIQPLYGRTFSRQLATDEYSGVLVNEQWIRFMGLTQNYEDLIGFRLNDRYRIIGILPDFHFNSLHQPIGPLMMAWHDGSSYIINIRIDQNRQEEALAYINKVWMEISPDEAPEYHFLEDTLSQLYTGEKRMGKLFASFAGFAILIACIGLFGLASFSAEKRTREIAIRKILGATTQRLVRMLLSDFLVLTGVAFLIAIPLVRIGMGYWLNQFPYHIQLSLLPFVMAGSIAFLLTTTTVGYHAVKTSHGNPVESLNKQ